MFDLIATVTPRKGNDYKVRLSVHIRFDYQYCFYFTRTRKPDNLEIARLHADLDCDSGKGYMLNHYDRLCDTNCLRARPPPPRGGEAKETNKLF